MCLVRREGEGRGGEETRTAHRRRSRVGTGRHCRGPRWRSALIFFPGRSAAAYLMVMVTFFPPGSRREAGEEQEG